MFDPPGPMCWVGLTMPATKAAKMLPKPLLQAIAFTRPSASRPCSRRFRWVWLTPAVMLLQLSSAFAQTLPEPRRSGEGRPLSLSMAPSSAGRDAGASVSLANATWRVEASEDQARDRPPFLRVQAIMPGMPRMPPMPGMAPPPAAGAPAGGMGGMPMAMTMTGETMFEMVAGACAAGVLVGVVATVAVPPVTAPMALTNAGIGCGLGILATIAGMGGMMGARAIANGF